MRLIDADDLKEHLFVGADYDKAINDGIDKTEEEVFAFQCGWNDALKSVAQFAPTVDQYKHGHWEVVDGTEPRRYGCSVCKRLSWTVDNYCSYCGCKMDEVEDETN